MSGAQPGWSETKDPKSGRPYYWNKATNETSWIKPDDLLTPSQRATGWTQTSTAEGRLYWYNKADKNQTAWTAPQGWDEQPVSRQDEPPRYVSSSFNYPGRGDNQRDHGGSREYGQRDDNYRPNRYDQQGGGGYRGPIATSQTGFENATQAEREAAFSKLLKKVGVETNWTWEETVRATVQDPAYRAFAEPMERREAFEDYKQELKKQEAAREEERAAKLKSDFRITLLRHPEVKRYSRWKTIRPVLEGDAVFRSTDNENERRKLFDEYILELKQTWQEKRFREHAEALDELDDIMREIKITPSTKWMEAQTMLENNETFGGEKFTTLTKSEVLDKFSGYMRHVWDIANNERQQKKHLQARQARKNRDGFIDLIRELHEKDKLHATTSWQAILPDLESDPRYTTVLSNCKTGDPHHDGSTPLELFFDYVDDLEKDIRDLVHHTESVIHTLHLPPNPSLSFSDFTTQIASTDSTLTSLSPGKLAAVHTRLLTSLAQQAEESARNEERRERKRLIDALRSRIKRLEPAVTSDDTWEVVRPRIERLEEYAALSSEEDRRAAWERFVSRNLGAEDIRGGSRRDRDGGKGGAVDAYAEDRRRAIEQRERQYRRGGSPGGLSPPASASSGRERERERDRDRYDRHDRRDRRRGGPGDDGYGPSSRRVSLDDPLLSAISSSSRRRGEDRYERSDRRESHAGGGADRGSAYMSRADPYSRGGGELDYGDEVVGSSKVESDTVGASGGSGKGKRGAGDAQGWRDGAGAKRVKLNGTARGESKNRNNGIGMNGQQDEEDKAMLSGSEEGEIEEA